MNKYSFKPYYKWIVLNTTGLIVIPGTDDMF